MAINKSIVLINQESNYAGKKIFQIKKVINITEHQLNTYLNEDEINDLINLGAEVRIISKKLP